MWAYVWIFEGESAVRNDVGRGRVRMLARVMKDADEERLSIRRPAMN
jgi:hypothetical protein